MSRRTPGYYVSWKELKASSRFRNFLIFLIFVVLATVFWFIMTLNDNAQQSFDVRLNVVGVPDSVTFITDPPAKIHITVRDKGTHLFRAGFNEPKLNLNFRDFAAGGTFRFTSSEMNAALKSLFGPQAQLTAVSVDSLRLDYTTGPGKKVPIVIKSDVKATSGKVISARLTSKTHFVHLFSSTVDLDTVNVVYTRNIVRRNLDKTTEVEIGFRPIPGVKIVPSKIVVTIPVEPLVKKTAIIPVTVRNLKPGYSLLLFPDNMEVSYFVPMSKFNDPVSDLVVSVDFLEALENKSGRVGLHIESYPSSIDNVQLKTDSIEFTVVK